MDERLPGSLVNEPPAHTLRVDVAAPTNATAPTRPKLTGARKRVMLIASHAPSLMIFRAHLIKTLVDDGHEVLALAPDYGPDIATQVEGLGARTGNYVLARRGLNPIQDIDSFKALRTQMKAFQPDVVMGYTPKPAIYGALAARSANVPRIVPMITGLGYAYLGRSLKDRAVGTVATHLYRRALRASHAVVFHNNDDREQLLAAGALPPDLPAHVVGGSGVDLDHYTEQPLPAIGDGLTFLLMARLLRYKGVHEYCAAARLVKRQAPNARFLLVGPEELGPGGLTVAALQPWQDCITYLGSQQDVRPYLAQCHVFVLPSYDGEGLPRTILEAMATGRPIITTDSRGCRETVDVRVNGCLVPVADANALAEAMLSFLRRPDQIPAMARASRQKAARRFEVGLVTRQMMGALMGSEQ